MINKKEFLRLYLLQIFSTTFGLAIISFVLLYFHKLGASLLFLASAELLLYISAIVIFFFTNYFQTKNNFLLIIISNFIILTLLIISDKIYFLLPIEILRGVFMIFFWVPFNTLYFHLSKTDHQARHSVLLTTIAPVIGSFVPIIAGLVVQAYSYDLLFSLGVILNIIIFFIIKNIINKQYSFNLGKSIQSMLGVKSIFIIEGMLHAAFITLIPLMSLMYLHEEKDWGVFFSYLGLIGAITSIALAFVSDKYKIRKGFLLPLSILVAFSLMSLSFAYNFWLWGFLTGVFYVFVNLFSPFSITLVLDAKKNNFLCWAGREFILNIGRVIIMLIAILCIVYNNFNIIFLITGILFLAYPVLILKNKIY